MGAVYPASAFSPKNSQTLLPKRNLQTTNSKRPTEAIKFHENLYIPNSVQSNYYENSNHGLPKVSNALNYEIQINGLDLTPGSHVFQIS